MFLAGASTIWIVIVLVIVLLLVLAVVASVSFRVVHQAEKYVVERLGTYHTTWDNGIHFLFPFIDSINAKVSVKEQVIDFAPQPVITCDNVTMQIDTVVFYQITDPKSFTYGVDRPIKAIENLTATTLRNIIGELELDQTLTSRDVINDRMRTILDEATDPWGIKVHRVEVKNIIPPKDIREAMEKQMRAERERRESIINAEGDKRSAILRAEGEMESAVLRADAVKQKNIREAQGQAEALITVQKATAEGIRLISEAKADKTFLTLEAYKTLAKVADGQATKLIIPSDIQGLAGMATSLMEMVDVGKSKASKK